MAHTEAGHLRQVAGAGRQLRQVVVSEVKLQRIKRPTIRSVLVKDNLGLVSQHFIDP